MESNAFISINRNADILVAKQPDYIGVSKADWARLKKKVDSCESKTGWWMNVGFTLFGVAGSSILSYVTLPFDSDSVWVCPIIVFVGISSIVIGAICLLAHYREEQFRRSNVNDIKEVIAEIENSLVNDDTEE